jgi:hypothetical protein
MKYCLGHQLRYNSFGCKLLILLSFNYIQGYFYSVKVEPLKYAPENKMAVSGGITAGDVNRNTGAGYQGNQNTANDQLLGSVGVSPTPTSISPGNFIYNV